MKYAILMLGIVAVLLVAGCTGQGPSTSGTPPSGCTPNWQCGDWGMCSASGTQLRTCTDSGNCNTTYNKPSESQGCTPPRVATKEMSEMVLQQSDMPADGNWSLKARTERLKVDMGPEALANGWEKGYVVAYLRIGSQGLFDITGVNNGLSIYPLDKISKVIGTGYVSTANTTFDEMSKPNIGDDSRAWRVTETDAYGTQTVSYSIEFIKMNVYEYLDMRGTATDFELLKSLAKKAADRVG